jgi:hypothetical protein
MMPVVRPNVIITPMLLLLTILCASSVQASGSLSYTAPGEWRSRPPASSMRVAEFVVPRVQGDPEDGEVIVYYFGGTGGSVDANVQRWIGQFQQPAGAPADGRRTTFTVGDLRVTTVDVSGTYVAEVRPGSAERHNKPNFRMRAAVVETPRGPYFVRFTGPAKTVAAASTAFDGFLRSLRFK